MPADQLSGHDLAGLASSATDRGGQGQWRQVSVEFTDWAASEQAAVRHLAPLLDEAAASGLTAGWWFIRKHPCWRLRLRPGPDAQALENTVRAALDELAANGRLRRWQTGIYEAEEAAFGGPEGMAAAHDLFTADSSAIMALLRGGRDGNGLGRRELSVVLCTALLNGAALEWYEQGDAWHRVTRERPLPGDITAAQVSGLADAIKTLLSADATSGSPLFRPGAPLETAAGWAAAFRHAGRELGALARSGTLQRGLREILSYHVIFHWNRLGLTARQQALLARAARDAILGPVPVPAQPPPPVAKAVRRRMPVPPHGLDQIAARFPLLPRPQLACPGLETRVSQVCQLASSRHEAADREQRVDRACTALNQAALIAADCGMTGLAAELCERQLAIFRSAGPVTGPVAIASLQPLVNLARLDIRTGQPGRGYQTLIQLADAACNGGITEAAGRSFSVAVVADLDADSTAGRWLRDVLLHDGTRALAAAGRWNEAAAHAAVYDDQPGRLRDTGQARVIASITAGDCDAALNLIDASIRAEPWEHAVAACLRAWAHLTAGSTVPAMLVPALALARNAAPPGSPGMAVFQIRLTLTAAELAAAIDPARQHLLAQAADDALQAADAHAARDLLASTAACILLSPDQLQRLAGMAAASGPGTGILPGPLRDSLLQATSTAEEQLRRCVQAGARG